MVSRVLFLALAAGSLMMPPLQASSSSACPGLCVSEFACQQLYITTKKCWAVTINGRGYCNIWEEPCDLLPFFTGQDEPLAVAMKGASSRDAKNRCHPRQDKEAPSPKRLSPEVSNSMQVPART